jgi:chromate reductase, NAD(P)H dehydrogenase (quinone)
MSRPRILAFAGSARRDSFNKRLVAIAAGGGRAAGADVTIIDLADFDLPLFNQDLEAEKGLPAKAVELKKLFNEHHGLLLSCPEYNSSITPLLKNTIDWVSRQSPGEGPLAAYKGKVAVLISASPGALGGLRGLVHVRSILGNIGVLVLPEQVSIPTAHEALTPEGRLKDERKHASIEGLGRGLAEMLKKLTDSDG